MKRIGVLLLVSLFALALHAGDGDEKQVRKTDRPGSKETAASEALSNVAPTLTKENRSVQGLAAEIGRNGMSRVDLRGRFQHALVLSVAPDGTLSVECVDDARQVEELMKPDRRDSSKATGESRED